ncbi:MAG: DUF2887 domain-containing protein [Deltaproteobacteria bacterium]|nr:DUF2887 domain-containing protein [Deltaproteobacteria bacterium]
MEKSGNRGSDETFYRLMQTSGDAVLRLLGVTAGYPYQVQAETLKAKHVSPDIVAIPTTRRGDLVFLEFQGYRDPFIRHRLAETALLYCRQKNYRGPYILAIIYTEQAWFKAALPLKAVNSAGNLTFQGWPIEIILENLQEEELLAADPRLAVLAPYTVPKNISEENLAVKAKAWGDLVRQAYPEEHSTEILDLLIMFLMNRFRKINRKGFRAMMNFDLTDTVAGRQVFRSAHRKGRKEGLQEGERKGREKGREEGLQEGLQEGKEKGWIQAARENLLDILTARFGLVPQDIYYSNLGCDRHDYCLQAVL